MSALQLQPLKRRLNCVVQRCKMLFNCIIMIIVMLFAFVPILCLFTWMIPLFVLERLIPIQFEAFILNIPMIIWCTAISTFLVNIMLCIGYFIDKQSSSKSMSQNLCTYICCEIKNNVSFAYVFTTICHGFGILVFSSFSSFVFCVSPALYLCAIFWFIYEIQRESDANIKEDRLEIRQYLYQHCFRVFDDVESGFKIPNTCSLSANRIISTNISYMKQFAYHLLSLLLYIKRIHSGQEVDPLLIKNYIKCLQNHCESCNHQWKVNYTNIKDFRSFVCMEIGASLLIISHLSLFWIWTIYYSENQVRNVSIDFNCMTRYSQLLIYYIIEHSCIIIIFIAAAKIYSQDIVDYHAFEFFNLNDDSDLYQMLDEYKIPEDRDEDMFIKTYCKLLYVYLEQLITKQMLKLCVKDEWLMSLLCVFCCGDKNVNVLYNKQLIELLDECIVPLIALNNSDQHSANSLLIPMHNDERVERVLDLKTDQVKCKSLSVFAMHFDANINDLPYIQCSTKEIKQLIVNYVNFCSKK